MDLPRTPIQGHLEALTAAFAAQGADVFITSRKKDACDRVAVMYAGKIVESADVRTLFNDPQHPYTLGLLSSIPRLGETRERLQAIDGVVPSPAHMPKGCRFNPRCVFADARCVAEEPPPREIAAGHFVACWKAPVENHV